MRRILTAAAFVTALTLSAHGQAAGAGQEPRDKTIGEVKKAAAELGEAVSHRDEAALRRLLADDYVFTHSTGDVEDKAQRIASITGGKLPSVESASRSDVEFRVYGDAVVITSGSRQKSELNGVSREIQFRGIMVWVRHEGRWQLVAQQSTRVQPRRTPASLDPKVLDAYAGEYEMAPGRRYAITREGPVLIARGAERELTLTPTSETKCYVEGMDAEWTFYRGEGGAVSEVGVRIGTGREQRWKKVK
jgi:ketosteroid isomerase-like protein